MTTDTQPLAPTDAELWQLHMQMPGQHKDPIDFARAILAKWGAQQIDLPPLPIPDLRDVGTTPQDIQEFLQGYATEYAKVALAVAAKRGSQPEARHIGGTARAIPVYTAPQPAPAAQGDALAVVDVPDQCPYFGPSPHRDVWLGGWYARAAQESK